MQHSRPGDARPRKRSASVKRKKAEVERNDAGSLQKTMPLFVWPIAPMKPTWNECPVVPWMTGWRRSERLPAMSPLSEEEGEDSLRD